jgi:hypothetical protein
MSKRRSTPRARRPSTSTLITTLIEVGRPELLKRFRPDSCVESTRLVVEFLRSHGVRVSPLRVQVGVFNDAIVKRLEVTPNPGPGELARWERLDGSWSVGIGATSDAMARAKAADASLVVSASGGWSGHLVALIEGRIVVDLSLDQLNRPLHGINLHPVTFDVPDPRWLDGHIPLHLELDGCIVNYWAMPEDKSFLHLPAWRDVRLIAPELKTLANEIAS